MESTIETVPLVSAMIVVSKEHGSGVRRAIDDLASFVEQSTGTRPKIVDRVPSDVPEGVSIIRASIAEGRDKTAGSFGITAVDDGSHAVSVTASDEHGVAYGIYRLMEIGGKRYLHYADEFTPARGAARLPAPGFAEDWTPTFRTRGFETHTYHGIPLSLAVHEPSEEHFQMAAGYVDWLVKTRQNYWQLPLLDPDRPNRFLPIGKHGDQWYEPWAPHIRRIVDYAHERGVEMSANVGLSQYVSRNWYAVNPAAAQGYTMALDLAGGIRDGVSTTPLAQHARRGYDALLDIVTERTTPRIEAMIDKLMRAADWDEISWNIGQSEFTRTNADQLLRWLDHGAEYVAEKHPGVRTVVNSHSPGRPWDSQHARPFFNLVGLADTRVGATVHPTHQVGMLDKVHMYGYADQEHKLQLAFEEAARRPNTRLHLEQSYWVDFDSNVPYMYFMGALNHRHNTEIAKAIPGLAGTTAFTTAWEWSYWLNDLASAMTQARPDVSLTEVLSHAFTPFGANRVPMTNLMRDVMKTQEHALVQEQLIRYMQGVSDLTEFGQLAEETRLLAPLLQGTNTTPSRTAGATVMRMDHDALERFASSTVTDLEAFAQVSRQHAARARELLDDTPEVARRYHDELVDTLDMNATRAEQVHLAYDATVNARRMQLMDRADQRDSARRAGLRSLEGLRDAVDAAQQIVARREPQYREAAYYNIIRAEGPTMWPDRSLTKAHYGDHARRTLREAVQEAGPTLLDG